MRKPKYGPLPVFTSEEEVRAIIDSGSREDLMVLSLSIGEHWPDWEYAQDLCLGLANHADDGVRANACLGLAYIARTKRNLNRTFVEEVLLRELYRQSDLQWRIVEAINDINIFLKWNLTPMLPRDALELGLYRALRAEVPPSIRAITLRMQDDSIKIVIYRYESEFDEQAFEEVVISELDQGMPPFFSAPDNLAFIYESSAAFSPERSERILIDNPWALR